MCQGYCWYLHLIRNRYLPLSFSYSRSRRPFPRRYGDSHRANLGFTNQMMYPKSGCSPGKIMGQPVNRSTGSFLGGHFVGHSTHQQLQPGGVGTLIRHTLLLKKKNICRVSNRSFGCRDMLTCHDGHGMVWYAHAHSARPTVD